MNNQERGIVLKGRLLSDREVKDITHQLLARASRYRWLIKEVTDVMSGSCTTLSQPARTALQDMALSIPIGGQRPS